MAGIQARISETAGTVRMLDEHPLGFREHIHRKIRRTTHTQFQASEDALDKSLNFWPTQRSFDPAWLNRQIVRCQRCGRKVSLRGTQHSWWCNHCRGVVGLLQIQHGHHMVGVCAMGECEEPYRSQIVDDLVPEMNWVPGVVLRGGAA